ncbi:MAG: complex I subunit 4 family protein, partial [Phycisphaeraceae bacterium]
MDASLLPLLLILPILSAICMLLPNTPALDDQRKAWIWALTSTLATFIVSLIVAVRFNWDATATTQLGGQIPWIPGIGLSFSYGVDTISLWLVLLTTFLMPLVILGSRTAIESRIREYYFWLLLLEALMIGVFIARDIIFFYLCFELTLVPLYFLIGVFGSSQRLKAAAMFFLYTFAGSMLTLGGVLYVAWYASTMQGATGWTFDIDALGAAARTMSFTEQAWVLAALLAGFAVKVPLWPVHTWLPLAHTEAPTAGSVVLAGVLLKLGTYGLLRFALPWCPDAVVVFAPYIGIFAVVGILYTALVCWVQKDVKKLIAYSSVSHLGFCVLGLFALDAVPMVGSGMETSAGGVGSVMYMINHGLSTGALFLCIGMIYERFHTREMAQMSGLGRVMPIWATFTVFFVLASVGLPGLNGFVSEFLTLLGAFTSPEGVLGISYAVAAGFGMIFAAIYLLYMVGKVVFGPTKVPAHGHGHGHGAGGGHNAGAAHGHGVTDLNVREILTLAPLAVGCLVLGLT